MMSFKLALRNVHKSFKDYTIYFLTLMFGICIFYVFNSIDSQQAMLQITSSQRESLQLISQSMGVVSIFISVILAFLILYANRFLIRRRKKEFGVYGVLGMEKGQISRIVMTETIVVGLVSLAAGLVLGVFLSQGLAVVTAKMFEVQLAAFQFIFSPEALLKTILYFGIVFIVVMLFDTITISRQKLLDLLYAEKKSEKTRRLPLWLSVCIFVISVACLVWAYCLIIDNGMMLFDSRFKTAIALGCIGTLLFFFSLSGFFLRLIQQRKQTYFKNLNMFVMRQINSKINTTFLSLTMVCLMLFLSISTLSAGVGVANAVNQSLELGTPFDASYLFRDENQAGNGSVDLIQIFEEQGVDFDSFAKETLQVKYYQDPNLRFTMKSEDDVLDPVFLNTEFVPNIISLTDYNNLMTMQGKDPIDLGENDFAICSSVTYLNWIGNLEKFFQHNRNFVLNGQKLSATEVRTYNTGIETGGSGGNMCLLIVKDEFVQGLQVSDNLLHINYIAQTEEYETLCINSLKNINWTQYTDGYRTMFNTRIDILESSKMLSTLIAYIAIYIGIVFLITSAAVLAITQLSEANDNIIRYSLLRKIGAEEKMVNRALLAQIAIYFLAPLVLALVHSGVAIAVISNIVSLLGGMDIWQSALLTGVMLVIVYGGYFLATYLGSRSIINSRSR